MGARRRDSVGVVAGNRREFLVRGAASLLWLAGAPLVAGCRGGGGGGSAAAGSNIDDFVLEAPDANGLQLPQGFRSRVVARSGERPVAASAYTWHDAPDGGAVFASDDGGWVYVSNSEISNGLGGVGALSFAPDGSVRDAYPILAGTSRNCAGGATPWGTWLSCEEVDGGQVHECDPEGLAAASVRPELGAFNHEAVAVDPDSQVLYLTEDEPDGRLYRFVPAGRRGDGTPEYAGGSLEVAEMRGATGGPVLWHALSDPSGASVPTRRQVAVSTAFDGGEGIAWHDDVVYFSTKGDDRVWAYDLQLEEIDLLYDRASSPTPILRGVDNVTVSPWGDVLVAEDGGNQEIVALTPQGGVVPVVRVVGHPQSEVTGPAFDPSGTRLYFSSQRGAAGQSSDGVTYEVEGPFGG
ncbi:MAG: alkaline phosphatase PhoX [Myxococcota bacterium]